MSINPTFNITTIFKLDEITAQEFLAEVALTIDKNPSVKLFTIRFFDKFREERVMSLELCYEREGKHTKH